VDQKTRGRQPDARVSSKIQRTLKAKLITIARAKKRSLSNLIEKALKEEIEKYERKHGPIETG
jgi:predicted transcriptional regulator